MKLSDLVNGQTFRFSNIRNTTVFVVSAQCLRAGGNVWTEYYDDKTGEVFMFPADEEVIVVDVENIYLKLESALANVDA